MRTRTTCGPRATSHRWPCAWVWRWGFERLLRTQVTR
jgi:hypothetical protein